MGFNLKDLLNNAVQLDRAAVAQVNPFDGGKTYKSVMQDNANEKAAQQALANERTYDQQHGIPSLSDFTRAMVGVRPQDIPQDNLDGTYTGLQPGKGSVVAPAQWHPPLLPNVKDNSGLPYYTPISGAAGQYTDDSYYRLPINPDAIPKPMPLLKPMLGGNY